MQSRYNEARTLSVRFTEDYAVQGHSRPREAGLLSLRKQGKMRWDYSQPAGKVFVSDGRTMFLYTAEDNRVEKIPLKNTEDMRAPLAFLLGHVDVSRDFRNLQCRPGQGGTWLEAAAKTDRMPYATIKMLIAADGEVRQLEVSERDGAELRFRFSGERLNPAIRDDVFHFEIPRGAEVVDSLAAGRQEN